MLRLGFRLLLVTLLFVSACGATKIAPVTPAAATSAVTLDVPVVHRPAVEEIVTIMRRDLALPLPARVRVFVYDSRASFRTGLIAEGYVPGGTRTNLELASAYASFGAHMTEEDRLLVCDAQTSGGLLAALPADRAALLGWPVVGELAPGPAGTLLVD